MDGDFLIVYACQLSIADFERLNGINRDATCYSKKQKIRSKLGYAMMRHALSLHASKEHRVFEVAYGEYGKPYIVGNPFYFNISHSHNSVICGVSSGEIGVDIQLEKELSDWSVLRRFFSESEFDMVMSSENRKKTFTEIWAMKESYIKMLGVGLNKSLKSFSVCRSGSSYVMRDSEKESCKVFLASLFENYKMAVCVGKSYTGSYIHKIDVGSLIGYL